MQIRVQVTLNRATKKEALELLEHVPKGDQARVIGDLIQFGALFLKQNGGSLTRPPLPAIAAPSPSGGATDGTPAPQSPLHRGHSLSDLGDSDFFEGLGADLPAANTH